MQLAYNSKTSLMSTLIKLQPLLRYLMSHCRISISACSAIPMLFDLAIAAAAHLFVEAKRSSFHFVDPGPEM